MWAYIVLYFGIIIFTIIYHQPSTVSAVFAFLFFFKVICTCYNNSCKRVDLYRGIKFDNVFKTQQALTFFKTSALNWPTRNVFSSVGTFMENIYTWVSSFLEKSASLDFLLCWYSNWIAYPARQAMGPSSSGVTDLFWSRKMQMFSNIMH